MAMIEQYLAKHSYEDRIIQSIPSKDLKLVVVIPCYKEENIILSLQSLLACHRSNINFEILVVVNHSEDESDEIKKYNAQTFNELSEFASGLTRSDVAIYPIKAFDLPRKHAGVGLARKIGMDEALRRFQYPGLEDGIICAFDADATVSENYLLEVVRFFDVNPKLWGCAIYYEHPLGQLKKGSVEYKAIYEYELHLRYHIQCLKLINYPFSNHTVGSSMAVSAHGYASLGGMNKRKAGEDFYFLHKFSVINRLGELNSTTIYPSPRSSDRVPFGTGRAVSQLVESEEGLTTYHLNAFLILKEFMIQLEIIDQLKLNNIRNSLLKDFLASYSFDDKMKEISLNTKTKSAFIQRFYRFFNPFVCMKWLHYYRDHGHANIDVNRAAKMLLERLKIDHREEDLLYIYRKMDKNSN